MGFILAITGKDTTIDLGVDIIRLVNVQHSTPNDSRAKSTDVTATMWITGKLLSTEDGSNNSDTLKLFEWSLVSSQSADAYRSVEVQVISQSQVFRRISFPNAFVIDYSERYTDSAGVGEFTLILRQRTDKLTDIKAESGQQIEDL